ncbi:MAG: double-strand break repair helicase AddA [Alphaproteobacteria bacterium]|nr:double-strand break repair helicase AddA [Alphaproteobacteria bacterium]
MSAASPAVRASDPAVSAWVSANAGSGKTYVLTNRVIRLLLDGNAPDRLLCLTYTRAAAAEMRARVFQRLSRWALLDDAALAAEMKEIEGKAPNAVRMRRARQLFATALETPGGLKIQTIHAFCERLIGRFPVEANAPVPFRVLTEPEAEALKREARIAVLDRLAEGRAEHAMRMLAPYVDAASFALLIDSREARNATDTPDMPDAWSVLGLPHGLTPEDVLAEARLHEPGLAALYARAARVFAEGSTSDEKIAGALARGCAANDPAERFTLTAAAFHTQDGARLKSIGTKNLRKLNAAFFDTFDPEIDRLCDLAIRHRGARGAVIVDAVTELTRAVRAEYMRMKQARGQLDFDDLIETAVYLLRDSAAASWALYKLDGGLDHILIDEAQDTSPKQWKVVERIAEEFFAGAGAPAKKRVAQRTLFAVGDDKQSIFSFQGADPQSFGRFREIFGAQAREIGQIFVDEPLTTSRRSAPEILKLVDAVFAADALRSAVSTRPWTGHIAHRSKAKGFVEIWPLTPREEKEESDYWLAPLDQPREGDAAILLAEKLALAIKSWIGREQVYDGEKTRDLRAGDVLILVQQRGRLSQAIIRKLKQHKVAVAGADRLKLLSHIAVKDLIAYGRAALLPHDDLNLAALLKSPFFGLDDDQLFELAHARPGRLWQALRVKADEGGVWHDWYDRLRGVINRLGRDAPFDFYARLLAEGGRAQVLKRLGDEAEDVIDEFLAQAAAYEETAAPSLEGFLHWLELTGAEVKRDPDEAGGAVRVLTAHGSKGLEAPVVILPDTMTVPRVQTAPNLLPYRGGLVWRQSGTAEAEEARTAWMERQQAEHHRLLYVALTRPRDRLIVAGPKPVQNIKAPTWHAAILAGFERLEGTARAEERGETLLRYGTPPGKGQAALALEPQREEIPGWTKRAAAREEAVAVVRPSRLTPTLTFSDTADAFGRERGRVLHLLLQHLPGIAPDRREAAAARFLIARAPQWPADARAASVAQVLEVLSHPRFAAAFAPGSRAEVPIAGKVAALGPAGFISGQIDRLAVTDRAVLIVDYKTNRTVPRSPEKVPEAYLAQMALYREAMRAAFPGRAVQCALLWTEAPDLMALPDSVLDVTLQRLAALKAGESPAGTASA